MTTYDPAAVEALIAAAKAVLDLPSGTDGGLRVSRPRARALREAVAEMKADGCDPLRNAARVHCNCGGFFTLNGTQFVHADRCDRSDAPKGPVWRCTRPGCGYWCSLVENAMWHGRHCSEGHVMEPDPGAAYENTCRTFGGVGTSWRTPA